MSRLPHALLWTSYRLGGPALWDVFRGGEVKILMYHGITAGAKFEGVTNYYGFNLPVSDFELQLAYLKRHCNVISLADIRAGRLSKRKTNVVLTFDDGYENNYSIAFPLLKRYGMPAVYAVATAFVCDREPLWNDVIEYSVNHSTKEHLHLNWQGVDREFHIDDLKGRVALYNWLLRECVTGEQHQRAGLTGAAAKALGIAENPQDCFQNPDYRPLKAEQIAEMTKSGLIEFASHSVHHYALSKLDPEACRLELRKSKNQIEELTGVPCTTLCVPGGAYNSEVLQEAFAAGYELVLTSDIGKAVPGRKVLNRNVVLHKDSIQKFADMVHGPVLKILGVTRRVRARVRASFRTARLL
jgi:peptidoglycan/xylan/chitin deacetylase (PgdA/CDA1 family)